MKLLCQTCNYEWNYIGNQTDLSKIQCPHTHKESDAECFKVKNCSLFVKGEKYRCGKRNPVLLDDFENSSQLTEDELFKMVADSEKKEKQAKKEKTSAPTKKDSKRDNYTVIFNLRLIVQRVLERFLGFKEPVIEDKMIADISNSYCSLLEYYNVKLPPIFDILVLETTIFSSLYMRRMLEKRKEVKVAKTNEVPV